MLRRTVARDFRMSMGRMLVDYKVSSRDMSRSVRVEDALVDVTRSHCVAPMSWLDGLRAPTKLLPNGYYSETPVYVLPPGQEGKVTEADAAKRAPNAVRAGPLMLFITGQPSPVVVYMDFVDESEWPFGTDSDNMDVRIGRDAVEQCTLFTELRPGGLLSDEPLSVLRERGLMQTMTVSESPFARRPWTRMKTYFIDELQRGPTQKEFVGHNPRQGRDWRFSQYCKHFRIGIWREMTRTKDLVEGIQGHSSYQRTPQQATIEVRHMAPGP
jgi:hypothetical protein